MRKPAACGSDRRHRPQAKPRRTVQRMLRKNKYPADGRNSAVELLPPQAQGVGVNLGQKFMQKPALALVE